LIRDIPLVKWAAVHDWLKLEGSMFCFISSLIFIFERNEVIMESSFRAQGNLYVLWHCQQHTETTLYIV
jgi:hypothetical protein